MKTGDKAENFTLQNTAGKPVTLQELAGNDRVLLLFFPVAFSGTCTGELCKVRDNMKVYQSAKANVAAISVDSFFTLREFKRANNLNFTLLSDFNKTVSGKFNCLYRDFYGMKGVAKRAAFVINSRMEVEYAEVLEDADLLPNFREIQKVLSKT